MNSFSIYEYCGCGYTEAQLLSMYSSSIASSATLIGGKVVTSVNAPGLSTTFQVNASPTEVTKALWFALSQLNPNKYTVTFINQTLGYTT